MSSSPERIRIHLIIKGRVQGVYFRAATVSEANRLGVKGWVMNRRDGSVEVLVEGSPTSVYELIAWCRHGPPGARVSEVSQEYDNTEPEFYDFRIRR